MTDEGKIRFDEYLRGELGLTLGFAALAAILLGLLFVPLSRAWQQAQRTFHSAKEASLALFTAGQQENEHALLSTRARAGIKWIEAKNRYSELP